jgi:MFS family permease
MLVKGTIRSIDAAAGVVVVANDAGDEARLRIEDLVVYRGSQRISSKDLLAGQSAAFIDSEEQEGSGTGLIPTVQVGGDAPLWIVVRNRTTPIEFLPVPKAPPSPPPPADDTRGKWMALLAAFLGWMFDGLEIGLFPLVARPAMLELLGPQGKDHIIFWIVTVTATFLVGAAAGGILFGWLGDRIGRVKAMVWSVLTYSIFSGLCCFAQAPWHLGVLRFLSALGMGGEWSLGVALVMEIWPSKNRPLLAGLIGAAANVGFLLIGFLALALAQPGFLKVLGSGLGWLFPASWFDMTKSSWRFLLLLGAVPAFLTFFIRLFVPESEKWKHAARTAPKPRIADIFKPGIAKYSILGACLAGVALLGTWGSVQQAVPWAGQLAEQQSLNRPESTAWAQIVAAVGAIIGTIAAAVVADKLNRRIVYFGLCLLSLIVSQYLFRAVSTFGAQFLAVLCLANGLTAAFYGWLPLYLPELFPTRVRATGSGFTFNSGRILAAVGAVSASVYYGGKENWPQMCSVTSLIYAAGLALIWICPETKGKPLPE